MGNNYIWRSVNECKPSDYRLCLVWIPKNKTIELCVWNARHHCWDDSDGDDIIPYSRDVTHWIDAPLPPTEE